MSEPTIYKFYVDDESNWFKNKVTDTDKWYYYLCNQPGDQSGEYVTKHDYDNSLEQERGEWAYANGQQVEELMRQERKIEQLQHDLDNANYALAELRDGGSIAEVAAKLKRENEQLKDVIKSLLYIFDRDLPATSIGRQRCDEARDALQKWGKVE